MLTFFLGCLCLTLKISQITINGPSKATFSLNSSVIIYHFHSTYANKLVAYIYLPFLPSNIGHFMYFNSLLAEQRSGKPYWII